MSFARADRRDLRRGGTPVAVKRCSRCEVAVACFSSNSKVPPAWSRSRPAAGTQVTAPDHRNARARLRPQTRENLRGRLQKQGFAKDLLLQNGLVVQRETGEMVDRFLQPADDSNLPRHPVR